MFIVEFWATFFFQVFLSMLVKVISLDLPLWHRILVLEVLRVNPTTWGAASSFSYKTLIHTSISCFIGSNMQVLHLMFTSLQIDRVFVWRHGLCGLFFKTLTCKLSCSGLYSCFVLALKELITCYSTILTKHWTNSECHGHCQKHYRMS